MANKPVLPDIQTIIQMGINPKTGLPMKFGNMRCTTKEDFKKAIRKNDEQIAVNKYVWYNLPSDITGQELEKYLYYFGQLCFFYYEPLNKFFFAKYALDGSIDFYGRYNTIHPIPINSGGEDSKLVKAQEALLSEYKLNVKYGVQLPEDLDMNSLTKSCVLIHDYTKQLPQMIIPTQVINDPVIDMEAEVFPFLRTSLLMGTGVKGVRVNDKDSANEVLEGSSQLVNSALTANPYTPIIGQVDFQELTDGTLTKAQDYLMAAQSMDNFRVSLHGVPNGGLFEKNQYVNNAQTNMNMGGADTSLTLMDGLAIRQNFCNVVNSIWGLGIWCEPSETIVNMDLNGDGTAYDRNEDGSKSGIDTEEGEE